VKCDVDGESIAGEDCCVIDWCMTSITHAGIIIIYFGRIFIYVGYIIDVLGRFHPVIGHEGP
jgi:hypothetical protein